LYNIIKTVSGKYLTVLYININRPV